MQDNLLIEAISRIRARLRLRQADLAAELRCTQKSISKYESGKAVPRIEVLTGLWRLADQSERRLIATYLHGQISQFSTQEQKNFLDSALEAMTPGDRYLVDLAKAAGRPEVPEFLREIIRLYVYSRGNPQAKTIFERAAIWLSLELQMSRENKKQPPHSG